MKLELEDAYLLVEKNITDELTHPYYDRVTQLAKLYKQLITGKDIDDLLHQFIKRENKDEFEQRKNITQLITPAVAASVRAPFYKVGRVNNIIKKIVFKDKDEDVKRKEKLENALKKYYGNKSLDSYLQTRFVDLSFTDPNAFIVTEFDPVPLNPNGAMSGLPEPRPFEVSSTNAVNYQYKNNVLQWLLVRLPITYKVSDGQNTSYKDGFSYTLYFPEYSIRYTQVDIKTAESLSEGGTATVTDGTNQYELWRTTKDRAFLIEEFNHKSELNPAIRVGYKQDLYTGGVTCVNPMHDGMPYFMKSIKTVSEFDLTMALHAFPQKFQYVNKCLGLTAEIGCDNGMTVEGSVCKKCNGSGVAIHASAQDAVVMRIPNNKEDMMDLQQMVHYEHPPIELLEFQNKYINELKNDVKHAVFNSEIFDKTEIAATATEKAISYDSIYDVLNPFSEQYSDVYIHNSTVSAHYLDLYDAQIVHQFPKDFKFKDAATLLGELKLATDSGAPGYVRRELSNDIAEAQFLDKPDELKRIRIKEKFFPFPDKTAIEIQMIISNDLTTEFDKILYSNFDNIFAELEMEAEEKGINLYDNALKLIKEQLKAKVEAKIAAIKESAPPVPVKFGNDDLTDTEETE